MATTLTDIAQESCTMSRKNGNFCIYFQALTKTKTGVIKTTP